jgi:hypothetical protein
MTQFLSFSGICQKKPKEESFSRPLLFQEKLVLSFNAVDIHKIHSPISMRRAWLLRNEVKQLC